MEKAKLVEVVWSDNQKQFNNVNGGHDLPVQFNPATLKVSFANENRGGNQPGGSTKQYVGSSTSKLAVELLFDTTADGSDVRQTTEKIAFFIQAKEDPQNPNSKRTPPSVSFEFGSFIFRGNVDSIEETLDYFSENGVPLRATISLTISRQAIEFGAPGQGGRGSGTADGPAPATGATTPLAAARPGDNMQSLAARNGSSADWKAIAAANNIDDPLRLSAGALINVNAAVNVKVGVGASAGVSAGGGASAGVSVSGGASVTAGASAGVGLSAQGSIGTSLR